MGLQYYKPNAKNTGAALNVTFSSKGERKGVFFELLKQVSWDNQSKKGKFGGGAKILSKFNTSELGQFIDCIERGADFEKPLYHTTGETSSQINFCKMKNKIQENGKWIDGEGYKGYVLYVSKGDEKISIGLTFAETVEFREYLKYAMKHIFDGWYSDDIKAAKEYMEKRAQLQEEEGKQTANKPATKVKAKSVESFIEPEVQEEPENDIPF